MKKYGLISSDGSFFDGFSYDHDLLLSKLKISKNALNQGVVFDFSRYLASAIMDSRFSTQMILIGGLKSFLFKNNSLAFLINLENLSDLPDRPSIAVQTAIIYNYILRQQAVLRSIFEREALLAKRFEGERLSRARNFAFALQIINQIWQEQLDENIERLKLRNSKIYEDINRSLTKLFGQNRQTYPAKLTDHEIEKFIDSVE